MNTRKKSNFQGLIKNTTVAIITGFLAACGGTPEEDRYFGMDVEVLYNLGADRLERRQFTLAAAVFDEVERQHPYSVWARRAQLMGAFSYYRSEQYEDAILAAERFLTLHPGNRDAPYAYYLIALCYYEQIVDVQRDQRVTEQAMRALQEVVRRYPDSQYARDAQLKLHLTQDHLAGKEMTIGRYYMKHNQHLAAISRFKYVVDNFETTSHVAEALHRLVETYVTLGILPEAQKNAAVLGYNYPNSKWYEYSYELLEDIGLQPDSGEVVASR